MKIDSNVKRFMSYPTHNVTNIVTQRAGPGTFTKLAGRKNSAGAHL